MRPKIEEKDKKKENKQLNRIMHAKKEKVKTGIM